MSSAFLWENIHPCSLTLYWMDHVTCFGPYHMKEHDVYLAWAKAVEMSVFACFLVLFSIQLDRNVSYRGWSFSLGLLDLEWKERRNRPCEIQNSKMYPLTSIPWCCSHDYVLVQSKRDFENVIKVSNKLTLRRKLSINHLNPLTAETFFFWHSKKGNQRYWKHERNSM